MNTQTLSNLLGLVYQAGMEPERWSDALLGISDALGSSVASLLVRSLDEKALPFGALDPRAPLPVFAEYVADYVNMDELAAAARARPAGRVVTEQTAIARETLARSACYNDFYLRHDLGRFIGTNAINDESCAASLIVFRSQHSAPFTDEDEELMQLLVPHIAGALRIHNALSEARRSLTITTAALSHLITGVALLDVRGRVLWMNPSAEEIIAARDGLFIRRGELSTAHSSTSIALRRAIAAATSLDLLSGHSSDLVVDRPSTKPPYVLFVSPAGGTAVEDQLRPAAILFITDPARSSHGVQDHLRALYGLSPAEAALAASLCEGKAPQMIAEERGVTIETVRGQIKQILLKTDTHRQVELVRKILTGPAAALRHPHYDA